MKKKQKYKNRFPVEFHAHIFKNSLPYLFDVAERKGLSSVGIERLDEESFPYLLEETKELPREYKTESDKNIIKISKKNHDLYLPKAIELTTKENFHLLIFGDSKAKPYSSIESCIDNALTNDCLVIFDHPFANAKNPRKSITKQKEKILEKIGKKYSGNICYEWNAYCIPLLRYLSLGGNVNKKVRKFSEKLEQQGYKAPIISDGDIHARDEKGLEAIGVAPTVFKKDDITVFKKDNINVNSGKEMIKSLKENIMKGDYEINDKNKNYVPIPHCVSYFILPVLLPCSYEKPRS